MLSFLHGDPKMGQKLFNDFIQLKGIFESLFPDGQHESSLDPTYRKCNTHTCTQKHTFVRVNLHLSLKKFDTPDDEAFKSI